MMKTPLCLAMTLALIGAQLQAGELDKPLATQLRSDRSAATSQKKIDKMADQTADALQTYRAALQRAESLKVYNDQLTRLIDSQQQEMTSIQQQVDDIDAIETGVLPLMVRMTGTLSELLARDAPFLVGERTKRVAELKTLIDRADISIGEKFRRIMEAYMIEADYGRTIEAYRDELAQDGTVLMVDFLRIGRVGLYYQTLDGTQTGRWNPGARRWEVVSDDYRRAVLDGLRVARKQAPPKMLVLPIDAPEGQS